MQEIFQHPAKGKKILDLSKWKGTLILFILAFCTKILTYFAATNPHLVERLYASTIYPYIGTAIGFFSSLVPFSIAEFLLIGLCTLFIIGFCFILIKPKLFLDHLRNILHYILRSLAIMYILFYFLWGFNYYREDYAVIANMNSDPATYDELKELTLEKIKEANALRKILPEDKNGLFFMDESIDELGKIANLGFRDYQVGNITLDGNYGRIKPVLLSKYMSYTGIVGIFIPFTSEPTINTDVPNQSLLSAISHEIAHQRGFAKEDEANFIAYRANINNPDERFKYSGYYLAVNHLMNQVYRENSADYSFLYNEMSDGVKRDFEFSRAYWASKESKIKENANKVNDTYLKANNQRDGVKSYNGVVQLLLAEYKDQKIH